MEEIVAQEILVEEEAQGPTEEEIEVSMSCKRSGRRRSMRVREHHELQIAVEASLRNP